MTNKFFSDITKIFLFNLTIFLSVNGLIEMDSQLYNNSNNYNTTDIVALYSEYESIYLITENNKATNVYIHASNGSDENYDLPKDIHIVEYYTFPFIFFVGTVCNILTFIVMRRKKMRHQSTYFYMAVLAIADEMVLISGCLNFWMYLYTGKNITIMTVISCKLVCVALYATMHFSVWMVVIMTIERFIAVALPLQASRLCTVKRAKMTTFFLAICIFIINMHFFFTHSLLIRNQDLEAGCQSSSESFDFFMDKIWPWIDASIYSFIPLSLLIIFNILIVHNLIKASKNIEKINSSRHNNSNSNFNYQSSFNNSKIAKDKKIEKSNSNTLLNSLSKNSINEIQKQENDRLCYKWLFRNKSESSSLNYEKVKFKFKFNLKSINSNNNLNDSSTLSKSERETLMVSLSSSSSSNKNNKLSITTSNNTYHSSNGPGSSANRRLTIMLLVVSMTFFLTSMPIVTLQTIEQANLIDKSKALYVIRGIFLFLQYLNHSVNFFLYAVTGKTFRREFFSLFEIFRGKNHSKLNNTIHNPASIISYKRASQSNDLNKSNRCISMANDKYNNLNMSSKKSMNFNNDTNESKYLNSHYNSQKEPANDVNNKVLASAKRKASSKSLSVDIVEYN